MTDLQNTKLHEMLRDWRDEVAAEHDEATAELVAIEAQMAEAAEVAARVKRAREQMIDALAPLKGEALSHALDRRIQNHLASVSAPEMPSVSKVHQENAQRKVQDRAQALRQLDALLGDTPGKRSAIVTAAERVVEVAGVEEEYA